MEKPVLVLVAVACLVAAVVWARSARTRHRIATRVERDLGSPDAIELSEATWVKEGLAAATFAAAAIAAVVAATIGGSGGAVAFILLVIPAGLSAWYGRGFTRQARLAQARWDLERKAEETLSQQELAPRRWAERLAPEQLPHIPGFELGGVYQAGTGLMAGDFYDVFRVGKSRLAAVIGDVTGHGIEASITAFQAKYLLRVFLQQFRDPAQALEQLNTQMSAQDRGEEFISLCVVVFDTEAHTLRYCSAGHPAAWLWHDREVRPLRSTGPLLMLDPKGTYYSREIDLDEHDLCLLYTDGLAEARSGAEMFGEERIANALRRDPGAPPEVLCKELLEAAKDFAAGVILDDVAIVAVRRS
ncbi:MAG: PP2C family protein-serine/threonine phosphatase [Actinomycetota bacterium]|nr:PP2C family protein-serine/threonine phosphatase [Actinomycetota bacterium]